MGVYPKETSGCTIRKLSPLRLFPWIVCWYGHVIHLTRLSLGNSISAPGPRIEAKWHKISPLLDFKWTPSKHVLLRKRITYVLCRFTWLQCWAAFQEKAGVRDPSWIIYKNIRSYDSNASSVVSLPQHLECRLFLTFYLLVNHSWSELALSFHCRQGLKIDSLKIILSWISG